MGFSIYRLVSLGIFLICWTGNGSALRIVSEPEPFSDTTEKLNISCITDGPTYWGKSIVSIEIMKQDEATIAVVNMRQQLKMGAGSKGNMKAQGHVNTSDASKSRLTLTIEKPGTQDAGLYRCLVFFTNENLNIVEKTVVGNVTYQESYIAGVVTNLARKLISLLERFHKQNITLQTLQKQHTTFKNVHSGQKLDVDNLIDQIDSQNITITEQNKQQKLEIDILNDEMDRQKSTNMNQTKQIENQSTELKKQETEIKKQETEIKKQETQIKKQDIEIKKQDTQIDKQEKQIESLTSLVDKLNTDNTQKQQQLDALLNYIKRQNTTNHEDEIQMEQLNKRVFLTEWKYYDADKTYIRVFGKDDTSKRLSWTKANESCQSFGGNLVVNRDAQKNKFVYNLFGGKYYAWIGVRNNARLGFDFKYVDDSDVGSYHPWKGSQPDGDEDNDHKCVYMTTNSFYPGLWLDGICSTKYPYVCSVSSITDL